MRFQSSQRKSISANAFHLLHSSYGILSLQILRSYAVCEMCVFIAHCLNILNPALCVDPCLLASVLSLPLSIAILPCVLPLPSAEL